MFPIKPLLSSLIEKAKRSVTSSATPPASEGKPKPESNFDTITSKVKPLVANLFEQITKTTNNVISSTEVKKAIELGKNTIQKTGTFIGTTKEDVIDKTKLIKSISEKTITQAKEISTETVTKLKSSTQNFLTSIAKTVNNITESSEVKKALENSKLITKKVTETTVTIKENIIEQTKNLKPKLEEAALEARDSAVKTFGKLKENTSTFLETITKTVGEVAASPEVKKALKTSKTILEKAGETSREIKEGVTSKVEAARPVVKEAVSKTKDYISESAIKAKETATESFTKLKNTTYSFFDVITKPLKTLAENSQVKEIKNLGEKAFKNTKEIFTSLINEETNTAVKQATDKKKSKKTEKFNQQTSEDETVDENSKIILSKKSKRKNNKKNLSENNEQEVENNRRENQEAKNERKSENSAVIEEIAKVLPSQTSKSPDMQSTEVESTTPSETNASLLEAEETAPQEVLFAGFTDRGLQNLKDKLPDIVAIAYKKMLELTPEGEETKDKQKKKDDEKTPSLLDMLPKGLLSGLGIIIAGGALVLGGLAALVKGLNTDGPFKGILKILSQGGLIGGIKLLQMGATTFMSALGALARSPFTLMRMIGGQISRITGMFTAFGSRLMGMFSGGISMITRMLPTTGIFGAIGRVFTNFFAKFASKGFNFIPFIGPIISLGFAFSRLVKGDVVGGLLDVASALVSFIPGIGPVLGLGISVLNAFLDFKGGGSKPGATEKKTGILTGWLKGLGNLILKGAMMLPIIGPGIRAVKAMIANDYGEGLKQLAYIIPGVELIGALFGDKNVSGVTAGAAGIIKGTASFLGSAIKWIGKMIYGGIKMLPIIGPALKAIESFATGDFLRGIKQIAYIVPGFELIGGFFGDKDVGAVGTIGRAAGGLTKWLAGFTAWLFKKIYSGIKHLPVVGPVFKAIENFVSGDFLKGLKQLAYIFPPFEMIGALFGDQETGGVARVAAVPVKWMGSLIAWISKTILSGLKLIPIIGPAISAIGEFVSGNFLKGLKQLAYIFPPFELLGGLLGDKEAGSAVGKVGNVVGDWIKSLGEWISEKILNLPLIGPLIKGIKLLFTDPLKALKTMALGIPILGSILSFLGVKEESEAAPAVPPAPKSPFAAVKDMILEKARAWWKGTWGWVRWLAKKVLPENIVKALEEGNLAEEDIEGETSTQQANVDANNASPQPAESTPKEAEVTAQEKEQTASIKSTETTEKPESSTKETQLTAQASEQPKSFIESKIDEIKQQVSQNKDFKVNSKITGEDYLKAASSFSDKQKQVIEKINNSIGPKTAQNAMLAAVALTLKNQPSKEVTDQLASNNSKVTPNSSLVPQTKQETQTETDIEKTAPSTSQQPEQKTKPAVVSKIEKTRQPKSFIETKIEAIKQQSNQDKNFKVNNRIAADDYIVAVNSLSDKNKKIIEKISSSIGPKAAELAMLAAVTLLLKTKPAKELAEQKGIFNNSKESTTVQQTENNFNTENLTQTSENKNVENVSAVASERNNTMSATPEGVVESKEEMPSVTSDSSIHSPMVNADGKSDTLLAKIAANSDTANQNLSMLVHGFNNLAKALGQLGVSIAENPNGNTFVNARTGNSSNEKSPARTTEMAKNGNQEISKFRLSIEQMRQRPA